MSDTFSFVLIVAVLLFCYLNAHFERERLQEDLAACKELTHKLEPIHLMGGD